MSDQDNRRAYELVVAGREVEREIIKRLASDDLKTSLYASYTRTKSKKRLLEKLPRGKKKHGEEYSLESVTDIVGVRLITLFREDMRSVVGLLCDFLFSLAPDGGVIAAKPVVIEAIVYYSMTASRAGQRADVLKRILQKKLNDEGVDIKVEKDEKSEYSSIHIVVNFESNDPDNGAIIVPVEFQVRSVLEDAWAQFDHKLRYEKSRESPQADDSESDSQDSDGEVPPFVEKTLRTLKHFLDNSDDLVEIVRFELEPSNPSYTVPVTSLGDRDVFSRLFDRLGGDLSARSDLVSLLAKKEELDRATSSEAGGKQGVNRAAYGKLAEQFEYVFRSLKAKGVFPESNDWSDATRYLYYTVRMEEAYCRMFSASDRDISETRAAAEIYSSLITYCDGFPPLHFRFALACGTLGRPETAVLHMREAYEMAKSFPSDELSDDGVMADSERKVILGGAKKHLSYMLYKKSLRHLGRGDAEDRAEEWDMAVESLLEGLKVALEGLDESEPADASRLPYFNKVVGLHNELLILGMSPRFNASELEPLVSKVLSEGRAEQIFEDFSSQIQGVEGESINYWNTLSEAFVLRKLPKSAVRFAKMVQREVNSKDFDETSWDQSLLRLIRNSAYWVIETNGKSSVEPE